MPNVFSGTWPQNVAHDRPSGASLFLVKVTGDAAYYALGAPRDTKLNIVGRGKDDTLLRKLSWGFNPEITIPSIQASATEIKILDELILKAPVAFGITELDGKVFKDDGTKIGLRWKLTCGGRMDDFRILEYMVMGNLDKTELDACWTNTPLTPGSPATSDALYSLAQTNIVANQMPNGLSKLEFQAVGDDDYCDFGDFEDSSYTWECLGPMGAGGRQIPRTTAIKFTGLVKGLQTTLTEAQLMDSMIANSINTKWTHLDGMVMTLPGTNFGFTPSYKNEGNADKWRTIDVEITGVMTPNAAGTNFVTTGGTTWDGLFT